MSDYYRIRAIVSSTIFSLFEELGMFCGVGHKTLAFPLNLGSCPEKYDDAITLNTIFILHKYLSEDVRYIKLLCSQIKYSKEFYL